MAVQSVDKVGIQYASYSSAFNAAVAIWIVESKPAHNPAANTVVRWLLNTNKVETYSTIFLK